MQEEDYISLAPGKTWWDIVSRHARDYPDRIALAYEDEHMSYAELAASVDQCTQQFAALGVSSGNCIAVLAPPRPEAMITFFAAARLGAVWVGLNPRYRIRELAYVIGHAKPTLVVSVKGFEERDYVSDVQAAMVEAADTALPCTTIFFDGNDRAPDTLHAALNQAGGATSSVFAPTPIEPSEPAMLVYTSGTTGNPKGVLLSQEALIFRSTVQAHTFAVQSHPVVINFAPINHIGGMHFRGLSQILAAGTIVYQDRYRTSEVTPLIQRHGVNMLMLGSTMMQMLLRDPTFDISILRKMEWFIFSGAAIPMPILQKISHYCPKIGSTYGLTESCGSVSYIVDSDSLESAAYTIGLAVPEGQLRVADESGTTLAAGQTGELQVRKRYCMSEYLHDPKATASALTDDGWLKTGDTALMQEDGRFKLVGRIKEMYKSGGYNVYPREIEVILEQHPDVVMAAVISVDDELYQQVGHAYVISQPGSTLNDGDLKEWCKSRLANYKVPKRIEIRTSLPMLSIGKVDKLALRSSI